MKRYQSRRHSFSGTFRSTALAAFSGIVVLLLPSTAVTAPGDFTEFSVPGGGALTSINPGPDGNLWFTAQGGDIIGRITTNGDITVFPISSGAGPADITAGPDGNMWFTEVFGDKIGRITLDGAITEFPLSSGIEPRHITAGPDGNLWFTEQRGNKIGQMSTSGVLLNEFTLPNSNSIPGGITTGPDGNLWFAEGNYPIIGRISVSGTEFPTSSSGIFDITVGPDGNLWFTDNVGHAIGTITTGGEVTEFTLPASARSPVHIATLGNKLWFTLRDSSSIASIITDGTIQEFAIPTANSGPYGIAAGADGNVWFTEFNTSKIGRFEPALDELLLTAEKDSFLRRGSPDRNEGANPGLRLQASGDNRVVVGFDQDAIDSFGNVTTATLVLTIAENADNWGQNEDRTVDAHPLTVDFAEGNGQNAGVPGAQSTRGNGPGVTWNCAEDSEIANQQTDCDPRWNGGSFGPSTAAPVLHVNGLTGEVSWDVTDDVLAGTSAWLIKKTSERQPGRVSYHSKESADPEPAPRLILEK